MNVIDFEVDQGARRAVFEQQAYGTRLKEHHAGRIENADWWCIEQALIKKALARGMSSTCCAT